MQGVDPSERPLSPAFVGLSVEKFSISRYQLDLFFTDDAGSRTGAITLEGLIKITTPTGSFQYDIQAAQGIVPAGLFFGTKVTSIEYVPGQSLTLGFDADFGVRCTPPSAGDEFGSVRSSAPNADFFLALT